MKHRITNPTELDKKDVNVILEGDFFTLQFDESVYNDKILQEINELCHKASNNLEIRFYGHKKGFDCNTLLKSQSMTN